MMQRLRESLRWMSWALLCAASVAPFALVPQAVLDWGPRGEPRVSAFPLVLALCDPFVWDCVFNSVAVAAIVACVAVPVGLALAAATARRRYWGRKPLAFVAWAPAVVQPAFAAMGLRHALGGTSRGRWVALVWAEVACAVPLVALAVHAALRRVEPAWEEAARALGGRPFGRAWSLIGPLVRPALARTALAVFALALLEPGAPWVLGRRRTLAFQIVEAARSDSMPTQAAGLGLIGLTIVVAARVPAHWPGRGRALADRERRSNAGGRASARRTRASILMLVAWSVAAWLPVAWLAAVARESNDSVATAQLGSHLRSLLADGQTIGLLVRSYGLGTFAASVALLLAWGAGRSRQGFWPVRLATAALERVPPLAMALGIVAIPGLVKAAAWLSGLDQARWLATLGASILDPYLAPGVGLTWALVAGSLPLLLSAVRRALGRDRPVYNEAAVVLGSTPRRARIEITARLVGPPVLRAWWLASALCASAVAPGMMLAPVAEHRPLGPEIVEMAESRGERGRAAELALLASAVNVVAFALVMRGDGAEAVAKE
jgi:iron(III) transport system permease protein